MPGVSLHILRAACLLAIFYHQVASVYAADKGSLQAQIPEYNLNEIDPKIKDQCHAQSVERSGFDPSSPDHPSKEDYQRQHFEAMGQGLVEEIILPKRYAEWRSRDRANAMAKDLKAQSERAQGYVRAYRECLKENL